MVVSLVETDVVVEVVGNGRRGVGGEGFDGEARNEVVDDVDDFDFDDDMDDDVDVDGFDFDDDMDDDAAAAATATAVNGRDVPQSATRWAAAVDAEHHVLCPRGAIGGRK